MRSDIRRRSSAGDRACRCRRRGRGRPRPRRERRPFGRADDAGHPGGGKRVRQHRLRAWRRRTRTNIWRSHRRGHVCAGLDARSGRRHRDRGRRWAGGDSGIDTPQGRHGAEGGAEHAQHGSVHAPRPHVSRPDGRCHGRQREAVTGAGETAASDALAQAHGNAKIAVLMLRCRLSTVDAEARLSAARGDLAAALGERRHA